MKKTINDYIINNELNSRLYEVLLCLTDRKTCEKTKPKKPIEFFNQAYAICEELQQEKQPEETALIIWERLRSQFLLCETNIIFSCVYVIMFFSEKKNPNIKFFLTLIKHKIDNGYFQEFEPLIREELTYLTTLTTDFGTLKKRADEITDLNVKELFLLDHLTQHQQAKSKSNIMQQITAEIALVQRTKELLNIKTKNDVASIKVRSAAILELLKKIQQGKTHNDLSKICKLISFLTGTSYSNIYNEMQKGISFAEYHSKEIEEINKIFSELNISISIDKNK
jgi:hypothetical protein